MARDLTPESSARSNASWSFGAVTAARPEGEASVPRLALVLLPLCLACAGRSLASERLEATPRHDEWVRIERGGRTLHAYVTYPEVSHRAPAILVLHENRGLTDWVRTVADRLSENGFLAIAPDLLSGMAPDGGRTSGFSSQDAAREAISGLPPAQVMADLDAAADFVTKLPAADGTLRVVGFCWGGARTFDFANVRAGLVSSFVFYGTGPQDEAQARGISSPVYGFYGGADARVNATVPRTEELMRAGNKRFEPVTYEGAGHAFMRLGEEAGASEANRGAREQAWARFLHLLRSGSAR
jgi:carboxymethylenebutenolidase